MNTYKDVVRQLLTGKDNRSHDIFRWLVLLAVLTAILLTIFVVAWRNKDFDIQAFGVGIGAVFAAAGAALKLKETTEPDPVDKDKTTEQK